ncbi:chromosome segregation protein SMC-like [Vibrio variabilis]|uniref:Chromosome segregation protein SMC-like n=1 Tax=Vibrio variabilis TaxID=990271 RepID=A0ABQ0J4U0_9VIBR|nr:chromosome segregation protein SMC-like [Vibrio variabilis]
MLNSPDDWFSDEVSEWGHELRVTQEIDLVSSLQQNLKTIKDDGSRFNRAQIRNAQINFTKMYTVGESLENHMQEEQVRRLTGLLRNDVIEPLLSNLIVNCLNLSQTCDGFLNRFLNDFLMSCSTQLHDLRLNFDSVFIENLCHKLHNSINDGQIRLSDLNEKLKNHTFGEERYRFNWKYNPEFDDFRGFLVAVVKRQTEDGSVLENANLSEEHQSTLKKLKQDLIDKDEPAALSHLARLADYRNYRNYDLEKLLPDHEGVDVTISLSQYATGSGGQLETPSYVIRAAALSAALQFDEPGSHCRFVIIDESFGKMDEARSKEVLNYLSGTLGLQVIFVMPTKSAGAFLLSATRHTLVVKSTTSPPRGELATRVDVIEKELNNPEVEMLYRSAQEQISNRFKPIFLDALDGHDIQSDESPKNGAPPNAK